MLIEELRTGYEVYRRAGQSAAKYGLTTDALSLLSIICDACDPITAGKLVASTRYSGSKVSRMLRKLGELGFIIEEVNPRDRRGALFQASQLGFSVLKAIRAGDDGEGEPSYLKDYERFLLQVSSTPLLTPVRGMILVFLYETKGSSGAGSSEKEIIEACGLSQSAVSGAVRFLYRKNCITLSKEPADNRKHMVRITDAGEALLHGAEVI